MTRPIKYSYEAFYKAVHESNGSHTTKIAEKVGCDRRTALLRLKFMASKKIIYGTKRGPVWFWFHDCGSEYEDFLNFLVVVHLETNTFGEYDESGRII